MTAKIDTLVIGGGIMGCALAFWLTTMDRGHRVMIVESDPTHQRSSTALSLASIRQQFTNPVNVRISRLAIDMLRDLETHLGPTARGCDLGFRENGYLILTGTDAGADVLSDVAQMQNAEGAGTRLLDPDALAERFPWLDLDGVTLGSLGTDGEGWFDNMGLLAAFRTAAKAAGAQFVTDRVVGLNGQPGHVVSANLADRGTVAAGQIVNAAGTRAAEVMRWLGKDLPVEPRKRTVFVLSVPHARHSDAPLLIDHTGFYMRPEGDYWLAALVPGAEDHVADPEDFNPDYDDFEERLWPLLYARAPEFDAIKIVRAWAGHYAYNRLDQNAILGLHPEFDNLYLMNGFSGHGLQQAPAVGRGIAELILTGAYQTLDLSQLCVERVLENRPFAERAII